MGDTVMVHLFKYLLVVLSFQEFNGNLALLFLFHVCLHCGDTVVWNDFGKHCFICFVIQSHMTLTPCFTPVKFSFCFVPLLFI